MSDLDQKKALLGLTAQIIAAHVAHNPVPATDLPELIAAVHGALAQQLTNPAAEPAAAAAPAAKQAAPAVPKRTIYPDYIICLEDGRKLKTLKRHLRSTYDLSPEQYREKWGLPADYPMVAPSYAERRSALAKEIGLGRKPGETKSRKPAETPKPARPAEAAAPAPVPAPEPEPPYQPTRRVELDPALVFANFTQTPAEPTPEPETAAVEAALKRKTRKPFSKQLARSMRG